MPAPEQILNLIARFREQQTSYLSPSYNETLLRRDFVDPLFEALGWDVQNRAGLAEAYRDVVHEDSLKVGAATKAPDYAFRIGGVRKFFVETKKPAVHIAEDPEPAYQLRRYGWSAKLPLCILTDFEEFAVYDTRVRPEKGDKASTARVLLLRYEEYAECWDELERLFSKEAILKGRFDRFAESTRAKRGTAEVDEAFLAEIESWRELLARNIAARNPALSPRALNEAVQKTIDRIVFLRICEDRGIEDYARLQALLNGSAVYPRLCQLFEQADDRYNSGLFHFHQERGRTEPPDAWTLSLQIDDKPLKEILRRLYYPDSPYEFSVLPADILGQVYEQFLGRVIRLTSAGRAKVEAKPEVKKAGGVFYTPTYIVRYIVENTLGPLLADLEPHEAAGRTATTFVPARNARPLKVLDPACGSGSFLLEAYQFLLDWYRDRYIAQGPERHGVRLYQRGAGDYRLTTAERKRILLDHIYGVDIDPQAIEVTKLSLLLKVLEGESRESLQRQLQLFQQRALPDLASNIKCGNALIGPDFYAGRQLDLYDEEECLRINAFDWTAEFPEIMQSGGFDAVIGNPPYVRMEMFKELKEYLRRRYVSHSDRTDLYVYFMEREHELLRPGGRCGMIVSNKFLRARYGDAIKQHLASVAQVREIVDLAGLPVFHGATVRTLVLLTERDGKRPGRPKAVRYAPPLPRERFEEVQEGQLSLQAAIAPFIYTVPAREVKGSRWRLLRPEAANLLDRLTTRGVTLKEYTEGRICRGVVSGLTEAFVIDDDVRRRLLRRNPKAREIIVPFLQGRSIRRYHIKPSAEWLIYTWHGIDMTSYPAVLEYLRPFKSQLENRATEQNWYELQQPQFAYAEWMRNPKIVFPDIATEPRFALDAGGFFGANTVYFIPYADLALLTLLNSRLAHFIFAQTCAALEGPGEKYLRFFGQYLEPFPVVTPSLPIVKRKLLASYAERMQEGVERLEQLTTEQERVALQRRLQGLTQELDRLIYALYELTEREIQLVEQEAH